MTKDPVQIFAQALPQAALDQLAASAGAAWLIDLPSGCVVATTAAGCKRLELAPQPSGAAPSLDAASPALARLRELRRDENKNLIQHAAEELIFWTSGGLLRIACDVSLLHYAPSATYALVREGAAGDIGPADVMPTDVDAAAAVDSVTKPRLSPSPELGHELRTSIAAVAAAAEIMADQRFGPIGDARYLAYVTSIEASARHALDVIERMMRDPAAAVIGLAAIDVGPLLEAVANQVRPLAEKAGLKFALVRGGALPRVTADATALRQIILNLVTNALKFVGGGGHIQVIARRVPGGALEIVVEDDGPGMRDQNVDSSGAGRKRGDGKRSGAGLGLGLPLARALAETNGAHLVIASRPGGGTTATIVFPPDRLEAK